MTEIEEDYIFAKGVATGCLPYMKMVFAAFLVLFIGLPCLMWGVGVLLYIWPLTLLFIAVALWLALSVPKGYKHGRKKI